MRGRTDRVLEYFTAEPLRVSAWLRLPLIGLIVVLVSIADIDPWFPAMYWAVLAAYTVSALVWVVIAVRGHAWPWAAPVATAVDILAVLALCVAYGPPAADLLPVLFLLPISVAFEDRPGVTAILGIFAAAGYLGVWMFYSKRDDALGMPNEVYLYFGLFLWLAAATTALCFVLTRRSARVNALLDVRRRLVSESMSADDRHNRELAEQLHDGPLQNLLAARLELDEVRERHADPALDAVESALHDTTTRLRTTVTALHPQVLAELGLAAALRELVRQYEHRFAIEADLEEVGRPPSQSVLYRAARELLANAHKHAQATAVRIQLARAGERIDLAVSDDGVGFDSGRLDRCVAEGHIGLASLIVRIDSMGGSMEVDSAVGRGTRVSVTVPHTVDNKPVTESSARVR